MDRSDSSLAFPVPNSLISKRTRTLGGRSAHLLIEPAEGLQVPNDEYQNKSMVIVSAMGHLGEVGTCLSLVPYLAKT